MLSLEFKKNICYKNEKLYKLKNILIKPFTNIYKGSVIKQSTFIGHNVLIRENCIIGHSSKVGSYSELSNNCIIGNNVTIHSKVFICEFTIIEDNVFIGPGVIFTNSKYPKSKNSKSELVAPEISKNVKIGAGSIILPGIKIGCNSLIGAGTIVSKNIPPNKIAYGNPLKIFTLNAKYQ